LAPSVVKQRAQDPAAAGAAAVAPAPLHPREAAKKQAGDDGAVFERMPILDFLEIPNDLKKPFTIPKGCVVTAE